MSTLKLIIDPRVESIFANYPQDVKDKMMYLRNLIIETAKETKSVNRLDVTLKWGEPSFVTKFGSTIRIDWKAKTPHQYAMYFQCNSRLIETFRLVFKQTFQYEGKRAIIFNLHQDIPTYELKACIKAALSYHKIKHDITLGL